MIDQQTVMAIDAECSKLALEHQELAELREKFNRLEAEHNALLSKLNAANPIAVVGLDTDTWRKCITTLVNLPEGTKLYDEPRLPILDAHVTWVYSGNGLAAVTLTDDEHRVLKVLLEIKDGVPVKPQKAV